MRTQLYNLFEKDENFDASTMTWFGVPVGFTFADDDINSLPSDYIQLRYDVTNTAKVYGDGKTQLRQSDCDIMILTAGAFSPKLYELSDAVVDLLSRNEIPYVCVNLGYDKDLGKTQITFAVVLYG